MTLDECAAIRENIAKQIEAIRARMDAERTYDLLLLKGLLEYCRKVVRAPWGEFGNVRGKIAALAGDLDRGVKKRDVNALHDLVRGLMAIDMAIDIHRHFQKPPAYE